MAPPAGTGTPSATAAEATPISKVRWASRVGPQLIRRLYERDAQGIVDEELIDDAGYALYARCRSILRVTEAQRGRVTCPVCETVIDRGAGSWAKREEMVTCPQCGWSVRWRDYLKTYQHKHLVGGGAVAFHEEFVANFERAHTPREKMLAIDRLIHCFHWELINNPVRAAARELIYAKNYAELLAFLDQLTYGEASTPGLRESRAEWERKLAHQPWHRVLLSRSANGGAAAAEPVLPPRPPGRRRRKKVESSQ